VRIEGDVSRSSELFFSPDRQLAAVKVRAPGDEQLQVARPDGSPPWVVRSGLSGLGDPLWSPDSQMIGFTESVAGGPVSLRSVRPGGQEIWALPVHLDYAHFLVGSQIDWVRCDP
jgi:hypothetical protein